MLTTDLVIFACLFHRILHFGLFSCGYFHCVAEHCVCFVTSKNFQADLIVECCTIQLLEIDTKTISNSLCDCCDTCCIVSKSVGTVTVLNNNFSSQCLFIFNTNVVIVVTVVDVHCSFRCWWLVCCAGFECFTLSLKSDTRIVEYHLECQLVSILRINKVAITRSSMNENEK